MKHIAIYIRVSSKQQDTRSQLPDLEAWAKSQSDPVAFYTDKATGRDMNRPGWQKIEHAMRAGKIKKVVIWRLDRLGRTAAGLTKLFEELVASKIGLFSLRDSLDLETPAGRLMANVLASVATYETEIRSERIAAGIYAAKKAGKRWGGSKPGERGVKATPTVVATVVRLKQDGVTISEISRVVKLSRPTIYTILAKQN